MRYLRATKHRPRGPRPLRILHPRLKVVRGAARIRAMGSTVPELATGISRLPVRLPVNPGIRDLVHWCSDQTLTVWEISMGSTDQISPQASPATFRHPNMVSTRPGSRDNHRYPVKIRLNFGKKPVWTVSLELCPVTRRVATAT